MAKKRKKRTAPENLTYEIEINDWEVWEHFSISPKNLYRGIYWETSKLTLLGNILFPELKNANKARINLSADPELDDHWTAKPTIKTAKAVGFMEIPRGEDALHVHCSIPPRMSHNIHISVAAGKIKYVSLFGEKLKWRKGLVFDISLSTERDEE